MSCKAKLGQDMDDFGYLDNFCLISNIASQVEQEFSKSELLSTE